jgi:hypothetical protein
MEKVKNVISKGKPSSTCIYWSEITGEGKELPDKENASTVIPNTQ